MGFLDDSWFHRSYWVYGKNFAGGHGGYFQAGKYTPEGRILVHDKDNVYGFARESKYYKWTTTMEHQLFSASKEAPVPAPAAAGEAGGKGEQGGAPNVKFDSDKLDIANTPLTVEMWILPDGRDGTIAQHGGGRMGYSMALQDGRPGFSVRSSGAPVTAEAQRPLDQGWHHLAGVLTEAKVLRLFVDGQLAAETKVAELIPGKPVNGLVLGITPSSAVTNFGKGAPYTGMLDQFAVFKRALGEEEIFAHAQTGNIKPAKGAILVASFDNGNARDESGNGANGVLSGVDTGKGKVAAALWFRKPGAPAKGAAALAASQPQAKEGKGKGKGDKPEKGPKESFVQHNWAHPVPIFLRAMAMGGSTVFVSGPPDMIDEEYAFERMSQKDPAIYEQLKEQDEALDGKRGASLWAVSTKDGKMGSELKLKSPPVWDGMAVAQGRLFVATVDGKVICFGKNDVR
jgi:hypothetical protein